MQKIKFNISNSFLSFSLLKKKSKFKAFTLAEILLSLTIIGIVAAIALPSLLGNANERAWETQKKALYTRFSQALPLLPSLGGYGTFEGTYPEGYEEDPYTPPNMTADTAAESFIRDGLSKVMKITNICAIPLGTENTEAAKILSDCGLPDKITPMSGGVPVNLSDISTTGDLHPPFAKWVLSLMSSNAAAFETVNGESVLVYYNPLCMSSELGEKPGLGYVFANRMCADFVYDLNGKKGPNTVGKDIGVITAFFSVDPIVVASNPIPSTINIHSDNYLGREAAKAKCKELDSRLPNEYEGGSLAINMKLFDSSFGMDAIRQHLPFFPVTSSYTSAPVGRDSSYWYSTGDVFVYHNQDVPGIPICVKR